MKNYAEGLGTHADAHEAVEKFDKSTIFNVAAKRLHKRIVRLRGHRAPLRVISKDDKYICFI